MRHAVGVAVFAVLVTLAGQAAAQACHPKVPVGPNPVPAQFDWTPLAKQWCQELAACGYGQPDCVAQFVATAKGAATPGAAGGAAAALPGTTKTAVKLACRDTEEAHAGNLTCKAEKPPVKPLPHGPLKPLPHAPVG